MENYGSFKNLAGDKKGMTAEEAYILLKRLGLLGQEFVPGATSIRKLMEGPFVDIGNNAKAMIIDELERKFPGYRDVMKGYGPGQSKFERGRILNASYALDPIEEKMIQRKSDAFLHDFPREELDEIYKQHKDFYENEIARLQERLDYMKTEPEAEQKRLADLYKQLEHKQEFYIQSRKALENAYNERIINDL